MADQAAAAGQPQPLGYLCGICRELVPELHRGGSCAHAFCRACLTGHVRAKIETGGGGAPVRCLYCDGKLEAELCRAVLPGDLFERWCAALCESLFLGARRVYCPFPNCSEMMVADDEEEEEGCKKGAGERVTPSECQVCRRLFCAVCCVPWHDGVDCDAYMKLGKGDSRRKEDMVILEMAEKKKWRRCPKCQFFVSKIDGCFHIICRCDYEFCYGCGIEWGSSCTCEDDIDNDDEDDSENEDSDYNGL
ncbi:probable E3 ubiquitin-protein ligase ARI10 [Brachypodium distachyon]|uniref:RBR-type E3 ubiquitin transferase n=1 Tax=Brachypodium distachyon TaxID=15368 RepID=I1I7K5_BRADI|nr:probable E3 ubiquitin-protein ligase ARI10 [Brachypodium distachyon]KQJ98528.1 hypothetical protein BRADI_3g37420v3 [Brachypodium distachyon]|eukprot:XP_003572259.1 probable E3 ubiquitin-protein ligase ARI10 [Brachypodium distachyon]